MSKSLIIGGSIGLFAGVLMGTVGGSSLPEEVFLQMIFGLIGGLGVGACFHLLTRKKVERSEADVPASTESAGQTQGQGSVALWLLPLLSFIAAAVKGFMAAASMQ